MTSKALLAALLGLGGLLASIYCHLVGVGCLALRRVLRIWQLLTCSVVPPSSSLLAGLIVPLPALCVQAPCVFPSLQNEACSTARPKLDGIHSTLPFASLQRTASRTPSPAGGNPSRGASRMRNRGGGGGAKLATRRHRSMHVLIDGDRYMF